MQTRIYFVRTKISENQYGSPRLVEAGSAAQAIGHVVRGQYDAHAVAPKELAQLMSMGVMVEQTSTAEPRSRSNEPNEKTTNPN